MIKLLRTYFVSVFVLVPMLSHAVILPLEGRLETVPGSGIYQAYYDPNLGITFLADANAIKTSGLDADGLVTWGTAMDWAAGLTVGGVSSWRLASSDVNEDGTVVNCANGGVPGCEDNELGFLFWEEGITFATPGPFTNIEQSNRYWTSTENIVSVTDDAWVYDMVNGGIQISTNKNAEIHFAWAVYDGDVAAVPVPAAIWLFGSGLLGLIGISRKKAAQ